MTRLFRIVLPAIVSLGLVEGAVLHLSPLPPDKAEARILIERGILDSALWATLEPFYAQPIRVPYGELSILRELVPQLAGRVPVRSGTLAKYEPWDPGDVERFLSDFPSLVPFTPILDFGAARAAHIGRVAFSIRNDLTDTTPAQLVHLSAGGRTPLQFDSRADLTDRYARWNRRSLSYTRADRLRIALGNSGFNPDPIAYGHYPGVLQADSLIADNWLYGNAAAWNGLSVELGPPTDSSQPPVWSALFAHQRPTEQIAGGAAGLRCAGGDAAFSIGASRLLAQDPDSGAPADTSYFATTQLAFDTREIGLRARGTYDVRSRALPVAVELAYQSTATWYGLGVHHYPASFQGLRSGLLKQDLGATLDNRTGSASVVALTARHTIPGSMNLLQEISGVMMERQLRQLSGALVLSRPGPLRFRAGYRYTATDVVSADSAQHELSTSLGIDRGRLSLRLDKACTYAAGRFLIRGSVVPQWGLSRGMQVAPVLRYRVADGRAEGVYAGLRHRLELFERTSANLEVEKPVLRSGKKGLHLYARAGFYF